MNTKLHAVTNANICPISLFMTADLNQRQSGKRLGAASPGKEID